MGTCVYRCEDGREPGQSEQLEESQAAEVEGRTGATKRDETGGALLGFKKSGAQLWSLS